MIEIKDYEETMELEENARICKEQLDEVSKKEAKKKQYDFNENLLMAFLFVVWTVILCCATANIAHKQQSLDEQLKAQNDILHQQLEIMENFEQPEPTIVHIIQEVPVEPEIEEENIVDDPETVDQTYIPQSPSYSQSQEPGVLNAYNGVNYNANGNRETYYNLPMDGIVSRAQNEWCIEGEYWVREDGVKMYGDYVIVAANLDRYPRGSIVETSLGQGIVLDTGGFAASNPEQFDIATDW